MITKNMLIGMLGGLAAGSILGILFAPDKGCNTRKKIGQKGEDLKNGVKDGVNNLVTSLGNNYKEMISEVGDYIGENKSSIGKEKNDLK